MLTVPTPMPSELPNGIVALTASALVIVSALSAEHALPGAHDGAF